MLARVLVSRHGRCHYMYNKPSCCSFSTSSSNITSIRLYRILMRMVTNKLNDSYPLQQPLTPAQYGSASLVSLQDHETKSCAIYKFLLTINEEEETSPFRQDWYTAVADEPYDNDSNSLDTFSLWASKSQLKTAIRQAFDQSSTLLTRDDHDNNNDMILSLQRLAMDAILYISQQHAIQKTSSISIDVKRGVRIIATSKCIGTTSIGGISNVSHHQLKYRFAYRIQVENLVHSSHTVQLLGRSWRIQDIDPKTGKPVGDAQQVHAPTNGAVGHLPVLQPGQVFEYMSGCDLFTKHGTMSGSFHMAIVDPSTRSAVVGDVIDVFGEKNPIVFEMPVKEFALEASDEHDDDD